MELWVARDNNTDELWAYSKKPLIYGEQYIPDWDKEICRYIKLPIDWFPEVTYKNSPKKVELKLVEEL